MAISPNYSWPLPDDTDLVKNGAEAIRDLGNAIDTTVDSLPSGGLVHIKTEAFSGAVSHSFGSDADPIFTSDYANYKIIFDNLLVASTNSNVNLRLRANTTDEIGSIYNFQQGEFEATTASAIRTDASTSHKIGACASTANRGSSSIVEIFSPQEAKPTNLHVQNLFQIPGVQLSNISIKGHLGANTTQFNGFTILASSNLSGRLSVYGYKI